MSCYAKEAQNKTQLAIFNSPALGHVIRFQPIGMLGMSGELK